MKSPIGAAGALNAYQKVAVQSGVSSASPHRLIQMLIGAAIDKISAAKGFMLNKRVADKGHMIGLSVSIIDTLRASLDVNSGGEVASNLNALYEYMSHRITEANMQNDPTILDEVISLLKPIQEAWNLIPEEAKKQHQKYLDAKDNAQKTQVATS